MSEFEVVGAGEALAPGTVIGVYRLLELLGEGGMGRVYVAEHIKLGRRVAVKMLRPELASNSMAVARFFGEARAVNRISHEHIVEITDFLEKPGGDNCYIMELLKGEDLGLRLLRDKTPRLDVTLDIAIQLASALTAVHAAGIIHRDLKPDNVFLIDRGGNPHFVKLLDFGVAKLSDDVSTGMSLHKTGIGTIIGTPEYMSPEQAGGQEIDHRSDIYALGVVLYNMVTGTLPFQAKSFGELVIKHMTVPVKPPSSHIGLPHVVPPRLDRLILDMLAKDPANRPQSMAEVEDRLNAIVESSSLEPVRSAVSGRMSTFKRGDSAESPPRSGVGLAPTLDGSQAMAIVTLPSTSNLALKPRRRGALVVMGSVGVITAVAVAWFALRSGGDAATETKVTPVAMPTEAVQVEMVKIKFNSAPVGATVRIAGTNQAIGITPFTKAFPREARIVTFEFEKLGHIAVAEEANLDASTGLAVALQTVPMTIPAPAAGKTTGSPKGQRGNRKRTSATKGDSGGTMNVFGSD